MEKMVIEGGARLNGEVLVSGAKNAALPNLAACLLSPEPVTLSNVPRVNDIASMLQMMAHLGARWEYEGDDGYQITCEELSAAEAPWDLVRKMRASILVMGPLLARGGYAKVSEPGGCAIGSRPVNLHIEGFAKLGAEITKEHGYFVARAKRLKGATITFPVPSVGATENLLMAATLAKGTTILKNVAQEPEVVDLAILLRSMGAQIDGEGTDTITIQGVDQLGPASHTVIPDRIEAGTLVVAGAMAGDDVLVRRCRPDHLEPVLALLRDVGVNITEEGSGLRIKRGGDYQAHSLTTAPHPGFPTDMQAQYVTLMTQAHGSSVIKETIFENRFMHCPELERMGANIQVEGSTAVVQGVTPLQGAPVMASDLRASASLVLAGLVAEGKTEVHRIYHLDRGYNRLDEKLRTLGARISRQKV